MNRQKEGAAWNANPKTKIYKNPKSFQDIDYKY